MSRKGFTLVEILTTIMLVSIVFALMFSMFSYGGRMNDIGTSNAFLQQDARNSLHRITIDVRVAKDISSEKYTHGKYYGVFVNSSGELVQVHYNGSTIEKAYVIDSDADNITFYREDVDNLGVLKITMDSSITSKSGKHVQSITSTAEVFLNNMQEYSSEFNSNQLYYTKYE